MGSENGETSWQLMLTEWAGVAYAFGADQATLRPAMPLVRSLFLKADLIGCLIPKLPIDISGEA